MEVMVVSSIIGVVSSLELVDLAASPRFKRVRDLARNWHGEGDEDDSRRSSPTFTGPVAPRHRKWRRA
jgi:hypothetical protein